MNTTISWKYYKNKSNINSRIKETEGYKEDAIKDIQEQIAERERRLSKIK